jgi:hypothetical protein
MCTGQILTQFFIGLLGSLLASFLIAVFSEARFNRAIRASGENITSSMKQNTAVIANEIKKLTEVVDKMREGMEKIK